MFILKKIKEQPEEKRIIANLYWYQKAKVKIYNEYFNKINIQKGVRQGCILSLLLYS